MPRRKSIALHCNLPIEECIKEIEIFMAGSGHRKIEMETDGQILTMAECQIYTLTCTEYRS